VSNNTFHFSLTHALAKITRRQIVDRNSSIASIAPAVATKSERIAAGGARTTASVPQSAHGCAMNHGRAIMVGPLPALTFRQPGSKPNCYRRGNRSKLRNGCVRLRTRPWN